MELRNIAKYGMEASEELLCQSIQRQGRIVIKSTHSTKSSDKYCKQVSKAEKPLAR